MVPKTGLEPVRLATSDFESDKSTNFITRAYGGSYGNRTHLISCLQGRRPPHADPEPILATRTGLEPVIFAVTGRRVDHLHQRAIM